jgi:SAM-dependent methyltransferase
VADDDHELAAPVGGVAYVGRRRAGREALVDFRAAEAEGRCGLLRTQERAREDGIRLEPLPAQLLAERPRLLAPLRSEGPQLVGTPRRGFGVADDQELHRGQDNRGVTAPAARYDRRRMSDSGDEYVKALQTGRAGTAVYYTKSIVKTEQQKLLEKLLHDSGRTFETVADIACGGGTLTYHLRAAYPDARFTLSDYNPDGLELARELNGDDCDYVLGDIYALTELATDSFDLVCCWQTLSWLDEPATAVHELVRIVKPGGLVYASSLFNLRHDVDIYSKLVDHTHEAGKAGLPFTYNTYSAGTVAGWLEGRARRHELHEFVPEIDFEYDGRGLGTFTVRTEQGRLQISAGYLMNWAILEIEK